MILHILECDTDGCQRTSATPMEGELNALQVAEDDGWYVDIKATGGAITHCPEHFPAKATGEVIDGVEIVTMIPNGSVLDMLAIVAEIEEGDAEPTDG